MLALKALMALMALVFVVERFGPTNMLDTPARKRLTAAQWEDMNVGLTLERGHVPDGGSTAAAIDHRLNSRTALTRHLEDGAVPIGNDFIERQIERGAMGRKA